MWCKFYCLSMLCFSPNLTIYLLPAYFALILTGSFINTDYFFYPTLTAYFLYTLLIGFFSILMGGLYVRKSWNFSFSFPLIIVGLWLMYFLLHGLLFNKITQVHNYYLASLILLLLSAIAFQYPKFSLTGLYHLIIGLCLLESLICIAQYFGILKSNTQFFQVTGTYTNPNVTAMFLAMALPVILTLLSSESANKRKFIYASLILIAVALLLLDCRTAVIGSIIGISVFLGLKYRWKRLLKERKNRRGAILLFAIFLLTTLYLSKALYQGKQNSADGRIFIWKNALNMVAENPLIGVGYGLFEKEYNLYQASYIRSGEANTAELRNAGYVKMAYNEFIQQAVEGGLLGMLIFLLALVFLMTSLSSLIHPGKHIPNGANSHKIGTLSTGNYTIDQGFAAYSGILIFSGMSVVNFTIQAIPVWCLFLFYVAVLNQYLPARIFVIPSKVKYKRLMGSLLILVGIYTFYLRLNEATAHRSNKLISNLLDPEDLNQASNLLSGLEKELSTSESYWRNYANILYQKKDYKTSLDKLHKAQIFTSSPSTYFLSGMCYTRLKQYSKASNSFEQAVFLEPNRFRPRYYLMNSAIKEEDIQKAITVARELIALKPKVPSPEVNWYKESASRFLKLQHLSVTY